MKRKINQIEKETVLTIKCKGNKTTACLNGTAIKATASCNPEDSFDIRVGVLEYALPRLFDKMDEAEEAEKKAAKLAAAAKLATSSIAAKRCSHCNGEVLCYVSVCGSDVTKKTVEFTGTVICKNCGKILKSMYWPGINSAMSLTIQKALLAQLISEYNKSR